MFIIVLQFLEEPINSAIMSHQPVFYMVLGGYGNYISVFFKELITKSAHFTKNHILTHFTPKIVILCNFWHGYRTNSSIWSF